MYSMLTALRVIDIWTAITLLSPPSGLSAACLQTATFLKVLGIDSKVFRQRGWSVLSPGRVTQHHWPGGETPNHWFSHLRSWVWKTHNLSRHIYKVRRKNRAATSVLYWSPRLGESVRMSKRLLLAAKPKGKRVRSAERLGEHRRHRPDTAAGELSGQRNSFTCLGANVRNRACGRQLRRPLKFSASAYNL